MPAKPKPGDKPKPVDYEAYFAVGVPGGQPYMHNVLLTFANAIPAYCHEHCTSSDYPAFPANLPANERQPYLRAFVSERLRDLAEYEYRSWINGQLPFVTPRELQIWRLRQFVEYIWFWELPDDQDLAVIFNLTQRRAANLAADFTARFRKTVVYPVALRRLYHLINETKPVDPKKHPRHTADGFRYRVPSLRMVDTALNLADDIRAEYPERIIVPPEIWKPRELQLMWIDAVMVDFMTTNDDLRQRLYDMYPLP